MEGDIEGSGEFDDFDEGDGVVAEGGWLPLGDEAHPAMTSIAAARKPNFARTSDRCHRHCDTVAHTDTMCTGRKRLPPDPFVRSRSSRPATCDASPNWTG